MSALVSLEPISVKQYLEKHDPAQLAERENEQRRTEIRELHESLLDVAETLPAESFTAVAMDPRDLATLAVLHNRGERTHEERIRTLLDNFYTDGDRRHLTRAMELLEHLQSL
jgi:hypothetical protein